jgi:hypothetical protein
MLTSLQAEPHHNLTCAAVPGKTFASYTYNGANGAISKLAAMGDFFSCVVIQGCEKNTLFAWRIKNGGNRYLLLKYGQ